jgi:hypothetical protein
MAQSFDLLRRTNKTTGAAAHRLALLAHRMAAAGRARLWKFIGLRVLRPLVEHNVQHLRDHVAGALDHHRIPDADIDTAADRIAVVSDALDIVLVMQCGVLHHHAADRNRLQLGHRRERTGAADLDVDAVHDGGRFLGRKFVRNRPARRPRHESEPLLPVEPVELVDDPVDVVAECRALRFDVAIHREHVVDRFIAFEQRRHRGAPAFDLLHHIILGVGGKRADLAPAVREEAQRARCGDARILLAQRTRGGVARVGELADRGGVELLFALRGEHPALFHQSFVERREIGLCHIDFAADLEHVGRCALQFLRNVGDMADVRGDILADAAVAARRGLDKLPFS